MRGSPLRSCDLYLSLPTRRPAAAASLVKLLLRVQPPPGWLHWLMRPIGATATRVALHPSLNTTQGSYDPSGQKVKKQSSQAKTRPPQPNAGPFQGTFSAHTQAESPVFSHTKRALDTRRPLGRDRPALLLAAGRAPQLVAWVLVLAICFRGLRLGESKSHVLSSVLPSLGSTQQAARSNAHPHT